MDIVDIPLKGGYTAKGHSRPTHGQMKALFRSQMKRRDKGEAEEIIGDAILILGTAWDVKNEDGSPIPFTRDGIDLAPESVVEELADKLREMTNDGQTIGAKLISLAETLEDDDPMQDKILALVPEGN